MSGKPAGPSLSVREPLCLAITRRHCVYIVHRARMLLVAPHVLYAARHENILEGVVVEVDGHSPPAKELEAFSVGDLSSVALTRRPFEADPRFDARDPHYRGRILCVLADP